MMNAVEICIETMPVNWAATTGFADSTDLKLKSTKGGMKEEEEDGKISIANGFSPTQSLSVFSFSPTNKKQKKKQLYYKLQTVANQNTPWANHLHRGAMLILAQSGIGLLLDSAACIFIKKYMYINFKGHV